MAGRSRGLVRDPHAGPRASTADAGPVFGQSQFQQPGEHSRLGTVHVYHLHPACCPRDKRDHAIYGALADPDNQRAIVLAAYPGTGGAGPDS